MSLIFQFGFCKDKKIKLHNILSVMKRSNVNTIIRAASQEEADALTKIAFAAKRSWNYPEAYFEIWKTELTITESYIQQNIVYLAEYEDTPVAFYSIVTIPEDTIINGIEVDKGFWLDHLFVDPSWQHKGIGTALLQHALDYCSENWMEELKAFSDPFATQFYEKMGAHLLRHAPSSIEGRTLPVYSFTIETE